MGVATATVATVLLYFSAAFTHPHTHLATYHTLVLGILAKVQSVGIFFVNIIILFTI